MTKQAPLVGTLLCIILFAGDYYGSNVYNETWSEI